MGTKRCIGFKPSRIYISPDKDEYMSIWVTPKQFERVKRLKVGAYNTDMINSLEDITIGNVVFMIDQATVSQSKD